MTDPKPDPEREKLERDLAVIGRAARKLIDAYVAGTVAEQFKRQRDLAELLDRAGIPR